MSRSIFVLGGRQVGKPMASASEVLAEFRRQDYELRAVPHPRLIINPEAISGDNLTGLKLGPGDAINLVSGDAKFISDAPMRADAMDALRYALVHGLAWMREGKLVPPEDVYIGMDPGVMTAAGEFFDSQGWQSAEAEKAIWQPRARPSDMPGITRADRMLREELEPAKQNSVAPPAPVETAKPALPALGIEPSGDHRLGLWRTFD